jgi:hypothetical protein
MTYFINSRARVADSNGRSNASKPRRGTWQRGGVRIAPCVPPRDRAAAESADQYPRIVLTLNAKTRVIECRDGLQWIIQRKTGGGRDPWRGVSFCRTKKALVRLAGPYPALLALPDQFPERTS